MSLKAADNCVTLADICSSYSCVLEYMSNDPDFCLVLEQAGYYCGACANFMADDKEFEDAGGVLDASKMIGIKKHNINNNKNSMLLEPADNCVTLVDICTHALCVYEYMNNDPDFCLTLEQQGYNCPACANFMADDKEIEDVDVLDLSGIGIKHNNNNKKNSMSLNPADDCTTLSDICGSVNCVIEYLSNDPDFCLELQEQGYPCPACSNYMVDDKEFEHVSGINIKHNDNGNSKGIYIFESSNNIFDSNYIVIGLAIFLVILAILKFIQARYRKNSENDNNNDDGDKQLQYNTFSNNV